MEGGGWRVEGGGWRVEGGGWRMEDRGVSATMVCITNVLTLVVLHAFLSGVHLVDGLGLRIWGLGFGF